MHCVCTERELMEKVNFDPLLVIYWHSRRLHDLSPVHETWCHVCWAAGDVSARDVSLTGAWWMFSVTKLSCVSHIFCPLCFTAGMVSVQSVRATIKSCSKFFWSLFIFIFIFIALFDLPFNKQYLLLNNLSKLVVVTSLWGLQCCLLWPSLTAPVWQGAVNGSQLFPYSLASPSYKTEWTPCWNIIYPLVLSLQPKGDPLVWKYY